MAIATAMGTAFKGEVLKATHNFSASGGNSFKLALYAIYVTGGLALTNIDPTTSGTTGFADFADKSFTTATITARGAMIYNDTNGDKMVASLDFGGNKTSTAGTFTIQFPSAGASTAIIRIA